MDGRGSSSGSGGGGGNSLIKKGIAPVNAKAAGVAFNSIPKSYQTSISDNLTMSDVMQGAIRNGNSKISDEWETKFGKEKRKVITEVKDGKLQYTVKNKNKIVLRTDNKNQVANKIAEFYKKAMKK